MATSRGSKAVDLTTLIALRDDEPLPDPLPSGYVAMQECTCDQCAFSGGAGPGKWIRPRTFKSHQKLRTASTSAGSRRGYALSVTKKGSRRGQAPITSRPSFADSAYDPDLGGVVDDFAAGAEYEDQRHYTPTGPPDPTQGETSAGHHLQQTGLIWPTSSSPLDYATGQHPRNLSLPARRSPPATAANLEAAHASSGPMPVFTEDQARALIQHLMQQFPSLVAGPSSAVGMGAATGYWGVVYYPFSGGLPFHGGGYQFVPARTSKSKRKRRVKDTSKSQKRKRRVKEKEETDSSEATDDDDDSEDSDSEDSDSEDDSKGKKHRSKKKGKKHRSKKKERRSRKKVKTAKSSKTNRIIRERNIIDRANLTTAGEPVYGAIPS